MKKQAAPTFVAHEKDAGASCVPRLPRSQQELCCPASSRAIAVTQPRAPTAQTKQTNGLVPTTPGNFFDELPSVENNLS